MLQKTPQVKFKYKTHIKYICNIFKNKLIIQIQKAFFKNEKLKNPQKKNEQKKGTKRQFAHTHTNIPLNINT